MERHVKILYTITIIAILIFLGMQIYWLYGRYTDSLKEYQRHLTDKIIDCVEQYNNIRRESRDTSVSRMSKDNGCDSIIIPQFRLTQQYGDTVKTIRTARLYTYKYSPYELLGLDTDTPLDNELLDKAMELAGKLMSQPSDSAVYDVSSAKDENEAWVATQNVGVERKCHFSEVGIDSILRKSGITDAAVRLSKDDSIVWNTDIRHNGSILRAEVSVAMPYSQLEGRIVNITCPIGILDVLPGMSDTLILTIIVSALLIVCLILQFSTVLKLSHLDKMRNSFITTMIHELKRPISTLKICVSGIENDKVMTNIDTRRRLIAESRNALDNLSAYFAKLRDLTFNSTEQIPLNIIDVNLRSLLADIESNIVAPAGKNIELINQIDQSIIVSADKQHMHNILNNLIENAIKYSYRNVTIKVSAKAENGAVRISINDNGIGIPAGDIRYIFDRFYRVKDTSEDRPGMGLGLTYVKLLVCAHGGDISVESVAGKGSCFTIELPQ